MNNPKNTLPNGWSLKKLGELVKSNRPITYGIVQTGEPVKNGIRCIRIVDLVDGRIDLEKLITTSEKISNSYKRTIVKEGDLIFALRGKVGDTVKVSKIIEGANLTRGVALISPNSLILTDFLLQQINSPAVKAVIVRSQNGSALQEIPNKNNIGRG